MTSQNEEWLWSICKSFRATRKKLASLFGEMILRCLPSSCLAHKETPHQNNTSVLFMHRHTWVIIRFYQHCLADEPNSAPGEVLALENNDL